MVGSGEMDCGDDCFISGKQSEVAESFHNSSF